MNRRIARIGILFILFALVVSGCGESGATSGPEDGKLKISASLYPLAFFAEEIGGEHVTVTHLVPPGVDAHDFEPTPKDVVKMADSDVLLYNGIGLEGWVDQVKSSLEGNTLIVNASKGVPLIKTDPHEEHGDDEHEKDHAHEHGNQDPHVWLDPVRAKQQAANIKNALVEKDPKHRGDYERNYDQLAQRLDHLHQQFKETVNKAEGKSFVVSHAACGYLADRYGLNQISVSGLSPSEEPSPKKLREVVKTARKHRVKYILFETLVSSKVAKTVQKEVGARPLTIHPLEGLTQQEKSRGENYFTLMKKNADHLGKALETK
ncbi:metal ABC transporter substrate-binding protein [Kroppenstedtia eburnea]|uniref:metal ABC transporter substrate-binding protein n=1 Tax=Kroppenstedtia eburnea TaxID=714067 RepID=UPI0036455FB0